MTARADLRRPRVVHDASGDTYIILARAVQAPTRAELGQGRYVADAYRLSVTPGVKPTLELATTGRAAPTPGTAIGYASERLRGIPRAQ